MFTNLIGYQFATTTEWPPKTAIGYQYIVGRNGVFIHDANPFFEVVAPVAAFTLRGDLPPVTPGIRLKQPKLPGTVLEKIIDRCPTGKTTRPAHRSVLRHLSLWHEWYPSSSRVRMPA